MSTVTSRRKLKYLEKNWPQCYSATLPVTAPTETALRLKPGIHSERLASNSLSYDSASKILFWKNSHSLLSYCTDFQLYKSCGITVIFM
jgi:hypothetical protein